MADRQPTDLVYGKPSGKGGRPAAFLDRDGVLIEDCGYPHRPEHLVMIDGAPEAVAAFNARGYVVIIVTNQAGIARGYFTEEDMHRFNALLLGKLAEGGGRVDAVYFCPFHQDAVIPAYRHEDHPERKPNPGMLLRAAADLDIDLGASIMIGDQPTDMGAARSAGVAGYRFEGGNLAELARTILAAQAPASTSAPVLQPSD